MQPFVVIAAAPFVGSFLGVLVRRLPLGRPIALDRSRCEACGRPIGVRDLVPIASYLALRGRCRACGGAIARMHLAIELAATVIAVVEALVEPTAPRLLAGSVLGWTLLALGWIDWDHRRLPDPLTLPLLLAGLAANYALDPYALTEHATAAAAGYFAFRSISLVYRRLRGREGLGHGDAKLLAAAGAWVGLAPLAYVVLGAALIGLAQAASEAVRGRPVGAATELAFGPCLALATWFVWLSAA